MFSKNDISALSDGVNDGRVLSARAVVSKNGESLLVSPLEMSLIGGHADCVRRFLEIGAEGIPPSRTRRSSLEMVLDFGKMDDDGVRESLLCMLERTDTSHLFMDTLSGVPLCESLLESAEFLAPTLSGIFASRKDMSSVLSPDSLARTERLLLSILKRGEGTSAPKCL